MSYRQSIVILLLLLCFISTSLYLISWLPNLKFTVGESGKEVPFLDIKIEIEDNEPDTSM